MSHALRTGRQGRVSARSPRQRTITLVIVAVITIAGLMQASAPSAMAQGEDWYWSSDNWESSRDPGGWDAHVLIGYERGADDYWAFADFSAYGERLYVYNATERPASVTLSVQEWAEYEDWLDVDLYPGECATWGYGNPPSDCSDLGGKNIPEDLAVIVNVCGQDSFGWTCHGEDAES